MHSTRSALPTRLAKLFIVGIATVNLAGCSDAAGIVVGPDIPAPKRTLMCVRESETGGAPEVQSPNAQGGCPDGFDLKVWY
ncbi:MAG: hypothetical protein K2R93_16570 [Gemmatimonadaceae bacterium]|nr:hypothetical protein [Gemmatimonadaceae bacterium]